MFIRRINVLAFFKKKLGDFLLSTFFCKTWKINYGSRRRWLQKDQFVFRVQQIQKWRNLPTARYFSIISFPSSSYLPAAIYIYSFFCYKFSLYLYSSDLSFASPISCTLDHASLLSTFTNLLHMCRSVKGMAFMVLSSFLPHFLFFFSGGM